ncbi:MAG: acyl-CoA dehydratase activase [Thermoplasmatota archaeon]
MSAFTFLEDLEQGRRIGLDIGSRSTKAAFTDGDVIGTEMMDTADFIYGGFIEGLKGFDVVTTGYGRNRVVHARKVPEIRAHTLGVLRSTGIDSFTLLDIGGQDFKVVRVDKKGIRDFHMNDKCAAGTGRFLEKMGEMLSMSVEELGCHRGDSKVLESTCSVFTETELISLMMEGATRDQLASGVIYSVYERVRPYLRMFPADTVVFSGGVSGCTGLVETLKEGLSVDVVVPERAQFMGAVGAMLVKDRYR